MIDVPIEFRPEPTLRYPSHQNGPRLEKAFHNWYMHNNMGTRLEYIPIYWVNYYVANGFGSNRAVLSVKRFLDSVIVPGKRYFTVCEYADGTIIDHPQLTVFNCGKKDGIHLPLMCDRHYRAMSERLLLASFVGRTSTHPVRKKMADALKNKKDIKIVDGDGDIDTFCSCMEASHFALCPRGYGVTSFRLYEAMQFGCVPIYISDDFMLPMTEKVSWEKICLLIKPSEIDTIPERVKGLIFSGEWDKLSACCMEAYNCAFSLNNLFYYIIDTVNSL